MTITFDRDIVFLDTETLGLEQIAPIWEFAAIRLRGGEVVAREEFLIQHNPGDWLDTLPEAFRADYLARYWAEFACSRGEAAQAIKAVTDGAIVAGSNPAFDMERLHDLLIDQGVEPGWHYHPLDIPSVIVGGLATMPVSRSTSPLPWNSSALSRHVGVDPDDFARHTAMGDVQWCLAQWQAMNGPVAE